MYLKFTTLTDALNCIAEINKRMGLNGNLTSTFDVAKIDIHGNYIVRMPPRKVLGEIVKLVRDIVVTNEEGTFNSIEIVKKSFDEEGNDTTIYTGEEYELVQQVALDSLFDYVIYTSVQFPVIVEEI